MSTLTWRTTSPYSYQSECDRYGVSISLVARDRPARDLYVATAWQRVGENLKPRPLAVRIDSVSNVSRELARKGAFQICEDDAARAVPSTNVTGS